MVERQQLARALYESEWDDADIAQPWDRASRSARRRYLLLADVALAYAARALLWHERPTPRRDHQPPTLPPAPP